MIKQPSLAILKYSRMVFASGMAVIIIGAISWLLTKNTLTVMLCALAGLVLVTVGLSMALVYAVRLQPKLSGVSNDKATEGADYSSLFEILLYLIFIR